LKLQTKKNLYTSHLVLLAETGGVIVIFLEETGNMRRAGRRKMLVLQWQKIPDVQSQSCFIIIILYV